MNKKAITLICCISFFALAFFILILVLVINIIKPRVVYVTNDTGSIESDNDHMLSETEKTDDEKNDSTEDDEQTENDEQTKDEQVVCLVDEMDSIEIGFNEPYFPDPRYYFPEQFSMGYIRDQDEHYRIWADDCLLNQFSYIGAYVEHLCTNYNFELVCEPFYFEDLEDYYQVKFSYVLRYTGDAHQSDVSIKDDFYTDYSGDILLCGYVVRKGGKPLEEKELHWYIDYAPWLTPVDDGTRCSVKEAVTTYRGESFGAGLNLLSDGSYQTTDGRLSASLNEAMFIIDGETKTYNAYMEWSTKNDQKRIYVKDKFNVDQMAFVLPLASNVSSGDIYVAGDMDSKGSAVRKSIPTNCEPMFSLLHNGSYISAMLPLADGMTRFNARMMYWDEDAEVAVLYFYAAFNSAPYEIEGLIAVNMLGSGGDVVNSADADYTIKVGETLEITGPSKFGANYSLWTWSYESGSECSELHDTVGQTCTLIARKAGTVRLNVFYEYSVTEYDILGNLSSVGHTQTEEYTILITE